ncbi:MAG: amidohydrolase family protein [Pseudomonadota bacterium]
MIRSGITLTSIVLLMTVLAVACAPEQDPFDVVIENVTVIDAIDGSRAHQDVVIDDGEIISVHTHDPEGQVAAKLSIDGHGKFLIPGLWDAHVHLTYLDGLDHTVFFPLSIAHGVTSLRDTGGHIDQLATARATAASDPMAPDLYVSGPLIDGPLRVYAGQTPFNPDISVGVASAEEARAMVDALVDAEVDFIKAYEMLSEPTFKALVSYATERGLPVSAHVPLSMTSQDAAKSGVGDMQHLRNLELSCGPDPERLSEARRQMLAANDAPEPAALRRKIHGAQRGLAIASMREGSCEQLISTLATSGVAQTPTLTISRFQTHGLYGDADYRASFDLIPKSIGEGWKQRSLQFASPTRDSAALAYDDWLTALIPRLVEGGVSIMAGTDAPIGFLIPGASLHQELYLLVETGMSPLQAIGAATIEPARFFGLESEMGTIAEGRVANLVLLGADPLADIRNIETIEIVFKRGRAIDRVAIEQLLRNVQDLPTIND